MDVRNVIDARRFSPEKIARISLFESERMFCDVWGLSPGQEQKPVAHEECDTLYFVAEGCGRFAVGGEVRSVGEGNIVRVPAGTEHSVQNGGAGNLTLLVLAAPHPIYVSRRA